MHGTDDLQGSKGRHVSCLWWVWLPPIAEWDSNCYPVFYFFLNNFHPQHVVVSDGGAGLDASQLSSGGSLANPWHADGDALLAAKEHNWMALLELRLMCHFWLTLPLFPACLEASRLSHAVRSTERGNSLPHPICLTVCE